MKKLISLILAGLMLTTQIYAEKLGHGDLAAPSKWAMDDISTAENMGILDGFKVPWTRAITREQFCVLSYNLMNFDLMPDWETEAFFTDTKNEKVAGLYNMGIISGRGNGIFDPDDKITREEAATILYNMASKMGIDTDNMYSTLEAYADDKSISDWAKKNVYNMRKINVMSGMDTGFMPKSDITVEQAISTLVRLHDVVFETAIYDESFAGKLERLIPDSTNYVISPFSVKLALMMAANGADGETKQEICDVLGIYDLEAENQRMSELLDWYNESDLLKLDVSNSIWINKDKTDQEFSEEYKEKVLEIFGAEANSVTDENAADIINGWVNEKTNGKITEIIDEENVDFWAMLMNAVYFKGRWHNEFSKVMTKPDIFTSRNGIEYQVDFMNKTDWMTYGSKGDIEIIELPYLTREDVFDEDGNFVETKHLENLDVSMYFVMSDNEFNPEMAVDTISTKPCYVALSVPKFKIDYEQNLVDAVKELGINKAFEPFAAEFSGMFTKDTMWITSLMHKTYINVDEEGTEAAAITAAGMGGNSLPPEPKVVKFNKPFHFIIRDNANEEILFIGEYSFGNTK